jgi:hypothetical protein
MAERGLSVDHTTVWHWVQAYAPEVLRRLQGQVKYKRATWFMDETYVRIAGRWMYLFRAVDDAVKRSISASQKPGTAKLPNASCKPLSRIQTTGRHKSYLWTGIVATRLPSGS